MYLGCNELGGGGGGVHWQLVALRVFCVEAGLWWKWGCPKLWEALTYMEDIYRWGCLIFPETNYNLVMKSNLYCIISFLHRQYTEFTVLIPYITRSIKKSLDRQHVEFIETGNECNKIPRTPVLLLGALNSPWRNLFWARSMYTGRTLPRTDFLCHSVTKICGLSFWDVSIFFAGHVVNLRLLSGGT